jgi:hypothetical protein
MEGMRAGVGTREEDTPRTGASAPTQAAASSRVIPFRASRIVSAFERHRRELLRRGKGYSVAVAVATY